MRYLAVLTPDTEEGGFTVTFPDLPGCLSEGDTADAAIENAVDALSSHVEGLIKAEIAPPPPSRVEDVGAIGQGEVLVFVPLIVESGEKVRLSVSLDRGILTAIDEAARAQGASRSGFIASAARRAIAQT
ncbi:type II toxin-antitoxin system HicB family antitoxin [Minwuia sp.]|uniref:type II toxin-antitoxin system HicB family antitoxin n=1 Tax=Minwuia sp. TaxID=2493630 RepID=UPI003A8DB4DA